MENNFDFIVIGGGSAGYAAASAVARAGKSTAIIDNSEVLGGLCILRGCMPSKTVIYSAEVLHLAQKAHLFGLDIPTARADMKRLHERKLKTIGEFAEYRQEQLLSDRFTLFRDSAQFIDEATLELASSGKHLTASAFLVSTGSVVNTPAINGLHETPHWISDDILELDELPKSIIILGGGVVACELSQYLQRMGTKVIQIQRSPLILKEASPESAKCIMNVFKEEGIELYTDTQIKGIYGDVGSIGVDFVHQGENKSVTAERLFNALGRIPNTANLGLDKANVKLRKSGHIETNENQQSSNPAVYAAGDCTGPHEIVHVAILQGEVAAKHALGGKPLPVNFNFLSKIIFTDPQVASVGLTESEFKDRAIDYAVAEYPFDDHGKSILMEAKAGYVKVWARKPDGLVLGAECVGKDAGELIHSFIVAVALGANVKQLLSAHWYHPTLSEIWSYPLEDIAEELDL